MKRKRLTQVFPFLLPIRKWQRKKLFYLEMLIDGNKYAKNKSEALLPNTVFETSSLRRQKQDHPKGSDKDEIQLPQSAACPTVWRIAAPSESTAGVESKTMRAFLLQKIHRLYLCQRDRWTCEARISHTAFSADSAKERYAEDPFPWSSS